MESDLISVIIPVYNVENYVGRCIESLLKQSYSNIELLIIDDGSTDNSSQICKKYASRCNKIRLFHKQNGGLSDARNFGLKYAAGNYITFIDSDDFVHTKFLELLLYGLKRNETLASFCSYEEIFSDEFSLTNNNDLDVEFSKVSSEWLMSKLINQQSFTSAWGKLFRKEIFINQRFPVGLIYEDMYVMPKIFHDIGKAAYSSSKLYFYNQVGTSITRSSMTYKKLIDFQSAVNYWGKFIAEQYPQLKENLSAKLMCDYLQLYAYSTNTFSEKHKIFRKKVNLYIRRNAFRFLFNRYARLNDKLKIGLFYLGVLDFFLTRKNN